MPLDDTLAPIKFLGRSWDNETLHRFKAMWSDPSYTIDHIAGVFGVNRFSLAQPYWRPAVGIGGRPANCARKSGKLKIPRAHPIIRRIFEIMNDERITLVALAEDSGVALPTIKAWRKVDPRLSNIAAVLNALDCDLVVKRREP